MDKELENNILKSIEDVKRSGITNIHDKRKILQEILENCKDEEVRSFIKENELDYLYLLELLGKF